ncbi:uncharacterized protein LOC122197456 [Lactuca sativa]|uniref:uncharacterized protein LOC122197456 n=1 Tax=Lactuca sativa TaxID=4236 RepID=UPI001C688185|nr:uncharacterized protein LOC122197456 [Lactuca sativa]
MYPLNLKPIQGKPAICLLSKANTDESWLWHRRLSHLNFKDMNKLVLGDHVRGLPLLKFDKEHLCAACEMGKQSRNSHPTRINTKIVEALELLHNDLCGPSSIESIGGSKYILVIIDDFSRFTWVFFLKLKSEATPKLKTFIKQVEVQLKKPLRNVRSDNGLEFKNNDLEEFLADKVTTHNFSAPFDVKADEGLFLGYSLSSKAYRVLNKRSKRIEETYYVTFDDNYIKKVQRNESLLGENFPTSGQVSVPISNLFEEYIRLFDEPEKAAHSEAKVADNKIDYLQKIIDDAAKEMTSDIPKSAGNQSSTDSQINNSMFKGESSSAPSASKVSFEGENSTSSLTNKRPLEGENPPLSEEANFDATSGFASPVEGEKG